MYHNINEERVLFTRIDDFQPRAYSPTKKELENLDEDVLLAKEFFIFEEPALGPKTFYRVNRLNKNGTEGKYLATVCIFDHDEIYACGSWDSHSLPYLVEGSISQDTAISFIRALSFHYCTDLNLVNEQDPDIQIYVPKHKGRKLKKWNEINEKEKEEYEIECDNAIRSVLDQIYYSG